MANRQRQSNSYVSADGSVNKYPVSRAPHDSSEVLVKGQGWVRMSDVTRHPSRDFSEDQSEAGSAGSWGSNGRGYGPPGRMNSRQASVNHVQIPDDDGTQIATKEGWKPIGGNKKDKGKGQIMDASDDEEDCTQIATKEGWKPTRAKKSMDASDDEDGTQIATKEGWKSASASLNGTMSGSRNGETISMTRQQPDDERQYITCFIDVHASTGHKWLKLSHEFVADAAYDGDKTKRWRTYIRGFGEGMPAGNLGLKKGDILKEINYKNVEFKSDREVQEIWKKTKELTPKGPTFPLTFYRPVPAVR